MLVAFDRVCAHVAYLGDNSAHTAHRLCGIMRGPWQTAAPAWVVARLADEVFARLLAARIGGCAAIAVYPHRTEEIRFAHGSSSCRVRFRADYAGDPRHDMEETDGAVVRKGGGRLSGTET